MKTIRCEECGGKNMVELDLLSNIANQPDDGGNSDRICCS
jgi:hypothetical protein